MAGLFDSLFGGDAGQPTIDAANQNRWQIGQAAPGLYNDLTYGANRAGNYLDEQYGLYQPLAGAPQNYANALGLNGAAGNAAATGAFHASPGYQYSLDQGLDSVMRKQASTGQLGSGNTLAALQTRGQGIADQDYNSWLDRLNGASTTALNGQSGALGGLATTYGTLGTNQASLGSQLLSMGLGANNQVAAGQEAQAKSQDNMFGNLLNFGSSLLGFL